MTDARLRLSWKVPWLVAPSPKVATATWSVPLYLAANPAPATMGMPPPTMPLAPMIPLERSARCIDPERPMQYPSLRPNSSAMARLRSMPFAMA